MNTALTALAAQENDPRFMPPVPSARVLSAKC